MKHIFILIILILLLGVFSCAKSYQRFPAEDLVSNLSLYEGKNVILSGIPTEPKEEGFSPPTPIYNGYWRIMISGILCVEEVNFENEPRIREARLLAAKAKQSGKAVTLSGVVKHGVVDIDSFEGIKTDTPFLKRQDQYYSYLYFYEWSPFAYKLNPRAKEK